MQQMGNGDTKYLANHMERRPTLPNENDGRYNIVHGLAESHPSKTTLRMVTNQIGNERVPPVNVETIARECLPPTEEELKQAAAANTKYS